MATGRGRREGPLRPKEMSIFADNVEEADQRRTVASMNIDRLGHKAVEAYVQKTRGANEKAALPSSREIGRVEQDEVTISQTARELQEALKAVQNLPEVRERKVAAIKRQVEEGTYVISVEALAAKLASLFKDD